MPDFAFLAGGKLMVQLDGQAPREIESPFAASVAARSASIARRNAWKTEGRGARFARGMEGLPQELLEPKLKGTPVRFTGAARGRHSGELLYTLTTGTVSGLFSFAGGEETRLFHDADIHLSEPACEPGGERLACTVRGKDGQSHIALLGSDGTGVRQLTEGDALDSTPCWVPGSSRIIFETRALGYDSAGNIADLAPAALSELDLDRGTLSAVGQIEGKACSSPRVAGDGTLYYLRRPAAVKARVSVGRLILDTLLFPFRMVMALVHYLNIFSLRYTGKPLLTAGDSKAKTQDVKRAALIGNLAGAAADARDEKDAPELPESWELVARSATGEERVVEKRVACFDLFSDGALLWSNGKHVLYRAPGGKTEQLASAKQIAEVVALPPQIED